MSCLSVKVSDDALILMRHPCPHQNRTNEEEFLPKADLDDPVWSEKHVCNSQIYLCIHQIPTPATPPPQPNQVEMSPEPRQMDIDIPEDPPDPTDVPEE